MSNDELILICRICLKSTGDLLTFASSRRSFTAHQLCKDDLRKALSSLPPKPIECTCYACPECADRFEISQMPPVLLDKRYRKHGHHLVLCDSHTGGPCNCPPRRAQKKHARRLRPQDLVTIVKGHWILCSSTKNLECDCRSTPDFDYTKHAIEPSTRPPEILQGSCFLCCKTSLPLFNYPQHPNRLVHKICYETEIGPLDTLT